MYDVFNEKICPVCKKKYIPAPQHSWGWYEGKRFIKVCSYSCHRKKQKQNENKRKYSKVL